MARIMLYISANSLVTPLLQPLAGLAAMCVGIAKELPLAQALGMNYMMGAAMRVQTAVASSLGLLCIGNASKFNTRVHAVC